MKRLLGMFIIVLLGACAAHAKDSSSPAISDDTGRDFAASRPDIFLVAALPAGVAEPLPGQPSLGSDTRWELGLSFGAVRFRAKPFSATVYGVQTSLSYFTNAWLGIEGNIAGNCWCDGVKVQGEKVKFLMFDAGPRLVWHRTERPFQPWAHALFGGVLVYPQTASGGVTALATQLGGGLDVRLSVKYSLRFQGDYIRSRLYSSAQNNFQGGAGIVAHF